MELNRLAASVVERSNTRNRKPELVLNQKAYGDQTKLTQESRACQFSLYKRSVLHKTVQVMPLTPVQSQFLGSYRLKRKQRAYIMNGSNFPPPRYLGRWQEKCCASSCLSDWISSVFLPARLPLKKDAGKGAKSRGLIAEILMPKIQGRNGAEVIKSERMQRCPPAIYLEGKGL